MFPHRDQFSGCLIGQCLGDALGFVVEGFAPAACTRYVEDILQSGKAGEFGQWPFPFGQYSDDSQFARELLQSYRDCKQFDARRYADRIARMFMENRAVGFGYSTKEAAKRLCQGVAWDKAGAPPPAAGNGSAMRAGPIGLMFFDDHESLIRAAHDQGRITHRDTRCSAGAVAIAGAVALVLRQKTVQPDALITSLSHWTEKLDSRFSDELIKLTEWLTLAPGEAAGHISRAGIDADYMPSIGWRGISPFVISSVLWSLYAFLRSPEDYWETICTAIAVGGDVDTTAAMAGAISGAYLGIGAIPPDLSKKLTDNNTWGYDDLVGLAHRCHEIKMQSCTGSILE